MRRDVQRKRVAPTCRAACEELRFEIPDDEAIPLARGVGVIPFPETEDHEQHDDEGCDPRIQIHESGGAGSEDAVRDILR